MRVLNDLCTKASSSIAQKDITDNHGEYPIYGASGFIKNVDFYVQEKPYIAIVKDGAGVGRVMKLPAMSSVISTMQYILPNDDVNVDYLAYALEHMNLAKYYTGATIPHIYFKDYCKEKLPEHYAEEQRKIANDLANIDTIIEARREQLAKLDELVKSRFIKLINDSEKEVRLDELIATYKAERCGNSTYPVLSITMHNGLMLQSDRFKKEIASGDKSQYKVVPRNKLVVAFPIDEGLLSAQTIVDAGIVSPAYNLYSIDESKVMPKVLEYILRSDKSIQYYLSKLRGTTLRRRMIPKEDFYSMPIQLPSLDRQEQFLNEVDQIDKSKLAIQESLAELETLKKALMQKYFG